MADADCACHRTVCDYLADTGLEYRQVRKRSTLLHECKDCIYYIVEIWREGGNPVALHVSINTNRFTQQYIGLLDRPAASQNAKVWSSSSDHA